MQGAFTCRVSLSGLTSRTASISRRQTLCGMPLSHWRENFNELARVEINFQRSDGELLRHMRNLADRCFMFDFVELEGIADGIRLL